LSYPDSASKASLNSYFLSLNVILNVTGDQCPSPSAVINCCAADEFIRNAFQVNSVAFQQFIYNMCLFDIICLLALAASVFCCPTFDVLPSEVRT